MKRDLLVARESPKIIQPIMYNLAIRLKDTKQKISGDLAKCLEDFKGTYDQIFDNCKLTDEECLRFIHNLLCKDAQRFYLDSVRAVAKFYDEAVLILGKEYNSDVRQTRVKNYLNGLRLNQFISYEVDTAAALVTVY